MTEFKITPEDVGRVAVDEVGDSLEIVAVTNFECCAKLLSSDELFIYTLRGEAEALEGCPLTHWKPRTLVAPKRWWNVYICDGSISAFDFDTFEQATAGVDLSNKVARIYAEHWHGCEEGTFHTPESIEGEES